jgi:hypothetical protein
LAPTNGQPPLTDLSALVNEAVTAAWGGGAPTVSSSLAASFASLIWEAAGLAGAMGLSWSPSS